MIKIKKNESRGNGIPVKITAMVLSIALLLGTLILSMIIKPTYAEPAPGTPEYYDARWEEAKQKKGAIATNTPYTTYGGGSATVKVEGPWNLNTGLVPWNGNVAAPTTSVNTTNASGATVSVRAVYTAEQFVYCLRERVSFRLMQDIDLNGMSGLNYETPATTTNGAGFIIDGSGYTVYNLYQESAIRGTSLTGSYHAIEENGFVIKNLTLKNTFCYNSGIIHGQSAILTAYSKNVLIDNCTIQDSFYRFPNLGATVAAGAINPTVTRCLVKDVVGYSSGGSTTGTVLNTSCIALLIVNCMNPNVDYCGAIDSVAISTLGHSGAVISCSRGNAVVKNTFCNSEIYGNKTTGAFVGVMHPIQDGTLSTMLFENCYASGKVEGTETIGGFISSVSMDSDNPVDITFRNCYSTSMVGMMSGGENMGSFIGGIRAFTPPATYTHDLTMRFENCYAAGEVGSLDTVSNADRITHKTVGGFVGNNDTVRATYDNCYYDKQTTAMREWATGASKTQAGISGMLTTKTEKSGLGMTNSVWTALGNAFQSEEEHYPQIDAFVNASAEKWGSQERANLVMAYSKASVSTVGLETYDEDYEGNALPKETYDTVRDLTAKFPLTSTGNVNWFRRGVTGQGTLSNGTGSKSDAFKVTPGDDAKDVLDLYKQGGVWYGDNPMPGIDWLEVQATSGSQTGSRKLRICPTVGMDAGLSKNVGRGATYDHADDMRMVYSTGSRLSDGDDANDYTYGVFPDDPLADRQKDLLDVSAYANTGGLQAKYAGEDDTFGEIDVLYMQRNGPALNAGVPTPSTGTGGMLNEVLIHEVLSEDSDGTLLLGEQVDLSDPMEADRWNGKTVFSTESAHKVYSVQYVWSLADGRYIVDSKRIEYPVLTHNVTLSVENTEGLRLPDKAYLSAYSISTENGKVDPAILPDFGSSTKGIDRLLGQPHAHPAAVAWKLTPDADPVQSMRITMRSIDGAIEQTTEIPASKLPTQAGETTSFEVTAPYRKYTYDANNKPVWQTCEIEKTYYVTLNGDGEYLIQFDKEYPDYGSGVFIDDVDMDIDVVLVIDAEPPFVTQGEFNFTNDRQDTPWVNGKADAVNDMPKLNENP